MILIITREYGFDIITDTGGTDTIVFKSGYNIKAPWKAPYRDGNNLVYVSENGKSGFTVVDHFSDTNKSIELFHYEGADGGAYSVKVRNSNSAVEDGSYDEALLGTKGDDTLTGVAGTKKRHDEFYGHEGNDTINNASGGKSWIEAGMVMTLLQVVQRKTSSEDRMVMTPSMEVMGMIL